jgi:hypothetical protein
VRYDVGATAKRQGGGLKVVLAVALFLAAGTAGAQMYKCAAPNGRITFSDRPCADAGVKQSVLAATVADQAKRMGISDRHLAMLQAQCRDGNLFSCQTLDDIKAGPAPEGDAYQLARRWNVSPGLLAELRDGCKIGNDESCLRYERMKRSSPEQEAKEKLTFLTRMCNFGNKDACSEAEAASRQPGK